MSGHVYMFDVMEYTKIGVSTDIEKRRQAIQGHCPYQVTLFASKLCQDPFTEEGAWHKKFKHRRVRYEWFLLNEVEKQKFVEWGASPGAGNGFTVSRGAQEQRLKEGAEVLQAASRYAAEADVELMRMRAIKECVDAASDLVDDFMTQSGFRKDKEGTWVPRRRRPK